MTNGTTSSVATSGVRLAQSKQQAGTKRRLARNGTQEKDGTGLRERKSSRGWRRGMMLTSGRRRTATAVDGKPETAGGGERRRGRRRG
ncbi:hypothetical protein E2562_005978 [Oryza meyeriana var. granulata]|uniref:Uncharacterized protein n=1 Tax=Oryza meyeriana var. granulata TaxID=110450 RepID=A0A6G1DU64_9ORYZ|nr:hypothetical protein E2562_005978 [Oryza meyeriana var. granulata]